MSTEESQLARAIRIARETGKTVDPRAQLRAQVRELKEDRDHWKLMHEVGILNRTTLSHETASGQYVSAMCENQRLRAQVARLRAFIEMRDPRNALMLFEEIAADYRRKFGWFAPGKDVSAAAGEHLSPEEETARRATWRKFVNEWHDAAFDSVLSEPKP